MQRLALSYAPSSARLPTLALLGLDATLARTVGSASEPMLAQLRLSWWREALSRPLDERMEHDPLLSAIASWQGARAALAGLVDGWEVLAVAEVLTESEIRQLASARGDAFGALAAILQRPAERETASRLGYCWALADIASHVSRAEERELAARLARECGWGRQSLSRRMRPLAVLHGLAARAVRRGAGCDAMTAWDLLPAMRIGFLGF